MDIVQSIAKSQVKHGRHVGTQYSVTVLPIEIFNDGEQDESLLEFVVDRILSQEQQDQARELIDILTGYLDMTEKIEEEPETSSNGSGKAKAGASGYVELKMIPGANGKLYGPYAYKRWRQGKTLRSQYLGPVKQQE